MKNVEDIYHLTPVQREVLAESASAAGARVVQVVWPLGEESDGDDFERAWQQVLARHTALRACFLSEQLQQPVQVVRQQVRLPFERHDWSAAAPEEQSRRSGELLRADAARGFDPTRPPLFRLAHVRLGGGARRLVLSHHPLLLDGHSADLLLAEALDCRGALAEGLEWRPEPPTRYRAYADWVERQDLAGAELFWRKTSAAASLGPPPFADADVARGGVAHDALTRRASLSAEAAEELEAFARRERLSLETLVSAAWALVLMREGGARAVCVGLEARERPRTLPGAGQIAGLLESVLPLPLAFPGAESVAAWLREAERVRAAVQRQAHVSRAQVRRWLGVGEDRPLFESAVHFQPQAPAPEGAGRVPSAGGGERLGRPFGCPLVLVVAADEGLTLTLRTGRAGDDEAGLVRLLESLKDVLGHFTFPARGRAAAASASGGGPAVRLAANGGSPNGSGPHGGAEPERRGRPLEYSLFYFADDNAVLGDDKYRLYLEGAKFADRHRLAAVWTPERHFHEKAGLYPNPSVLSAALAAVTEHVELRAGSVVLPLHHSLRVAEEWSVVDNLSKGRVGVSFTSGWMPNDFAFFPERYADKREEMFRGMREVQDLWRGKSIGGRDGAGKEIDLRIFPKPIREELPVWLTCSGGPEMFEKAGELGCHVLTALLTQSLEEAAPKIKIYRDSLARHGHDPASGKVTMMMHTFLGEDAQAVLEQVRGPLTSYLKSHLSLIETGAQSLNLQVNLSEEEYREKYQDQLAAFAFERYYRTASLLGTPTSCLKMVGRLKEIGVDEVACLIDFGVEAGAVLESLSHLAVLKELDERGGALTPAP